MPEVVCNPVTDAAWVIRQTGPSPRVVERILRELPDWFGIEESTRGYIDAATRLANYIAIDPHDDDTVGVLLVDRHFPTSAEIHLIAVRPGLHRHGIGKSLVSKAVEDLVADGVRILSVKTLGPSRPDPGYERTRRFYEGIGFLPVEELPDLWPDNPCLLMVKSLAGVRSA